MSDITIQKTKEDAASASLQVTVPVDRVRAAEDRAVRYYAKRARLPGFRPGKAPASLVRRNFEGDIRQKVLEQLPEPDRRSGWIVCIVPGLAYL